MLYWQYQKLLQNADFLLLVLGSSTFAKIGGIENRTITSKNIENIYELQWKDMHTTYKMYIMTPKDQMSQLLSYFSGPKTSGARK